MPLGEEVDISGAEAKEYAGGGFEDPFAFADISGEATTGEDEDQQQTGAEDEQTAQGGTETAGGEETQTKAEEGQAGDEGDMPPEPPEDKTFESVTRLQKELDQTRAAMMEMQARMQQMAQGMQQQAPVPPAQQQQAAQQNKQAISLDDIDLPSEDDWAENPNEAAKKINAQVAAKIAAAVERGVSEKVVGTINQRQAVQQQQMQALQSAVNLYPEAAKNDSVWHTADQILNNPANAALKQMPMGPFFAFSAAASVHGVSPVTASQQAQQQGMQQGAQAERQRQQRLKSGAMNTGGKEGQSTINLDPTHRRVAKQMGLSDKAYAEGLKMGHEGGA